MPATNFLPATYSVETRGDQWFMVIEERGRTTLYPAPSRRGAEVMISLEQKRREGVPPY